MTDTVTAPLAQLKAHSPVAGKINIGTQMHTDIQKIRDGVDFTRFFDCGLRNFNYPRRLWRSSRLKAESSKGPQITQIYADYKILV